MVEKKSEEIDAEEFAKDVMINAMLNVPVIEHLIETERCMKCGNHSTEYIKTFLKEGHYWVLKKCKNHDKRVDYIIPLDEYMGKIMMKYDSGEIYFK